MWKPPLCTAVEALTHGTVHISTMFRRSLWDAVGGFDPTLPAYEDMDFWLKAIAIGLRGEVLEEPLLFYRARRNSRYHRGIEPETYQAAMKTIIDKNMHLLNAKGLPVLRAKEAFLVQLKDYQDRLLEERNTLLNDIEALQRQTENIRTALAEKAHSSALQPAYLERSWPPSWELSVPGRCFSDFLKERRWLIRGSIAVVCDSATALDGIRAIRWDKENSTATEERLGLQRLERSMPQSYDCVILLTFANPDPLDDQLRKALAAVKPGGALLFAASGFASPQIMDGYDAAPTVEQRLREILAQDLPLDQFEIISPGNLTLINGGPPQTAGHKRSGYCFQTNQPPLSRAHGGKRLEAGERQTSPHALDKPSMARSHAQRRNHLGLPPHRIP